MVNSGKTIDKSKYQLHYNFCVKNNTKCSFCNEAVSIQELQQHIDEAKGDPETQSKAIQTADLPLLKKMQEHGADLFTVKGVSLMH